MQLYSNYERPKVGYIATSSWDHGPSGQQPAAGGCSHGLGGRGEKEGGVGGGLESGHKVICEAFDGRNMGQCGRGGLQLVESLRCSKEFAASGHGKIVY